MRSTYLPLVQSQGMGGPPADWKRPTPTPTPAGTGAPDGEGEIRFIDYSVASNSHAAYNWCELQQKTCYYADLDPDFVYQAPEGYRIKSVLIFVYTDPEMRFGTYHGWINPPDIPLCDLLSGTYCTLAKVDGYGALAVAVYRQAGAVSAVAQERVSLDYDPWPIAMVSIGVAEIMGEDGLGTEDPRRWYLEESAEGLPAHGGPS